MPINRAPKNQQKDFDRRQAMAIRESHAWEPVAVHGRLTVEYEPNYNLYRFRLSNTTHDLSAVEDHNTAVLSPEAAAELARDLSLQILEMREDVE